MFRHILIPTDGTALSMQAVQQGVQFAKSIGAHVTFFHSPPAYEMVVYGEYFPADVMTAEEYEQITSEASRKILSAAENEAHAAGVACATLQAPSHQAWEAIVAAAADQKCDLILMASHGRRGLSSLLLGSETSKVLTHSKIPVLVVR